MTAQPIIPFPASPTTSLTTLPNELLLQIAENLPRLKDLSSLIRTNRRLSILLRTTLLRAATKTRRRFHYNRSAFYWACVHGRTQLVLDLLAHGAQEQINLCDLVGTPLHSAVIAQKTKTVQILLSHGANPNLPNWIGWKAIHVACLTGNTGIVRMLLEAGADANERLKLRGLTPLMLAVMKGYRGVIEVLVGVGKADVEMENSYGVTLVQFANRLEEEEIFEVLVEKLGAKDTSGDIQKCRMMWPLEDTDLALGYWKCIVQSDNVNCTCCSEIAGTMRS
ncbi:ankyrin repeat-containing domain protein [Trichophaea hybrida]|nr:ankyrin repeat-containing domain protein [Trichophaea hybrida]